MIDLLRMKWIGGMTLGGGLLLNAALFGIFGGSSSYEEPFVVKKRMKGQEPSPLHFSMGLQEAFLPFTPPKMEGELSFSFAPPRPDGAAEGVPLSLRLKKGGLPKQLFLPCRVGLKYEGEKLSFSEESSLFWLELEKTARGEIEGKVRIALSPEEKREVEHFTALPQPTPFQLVEEFKEGTPFRILGEARWWGHDLFLEKYGEESLSQRLEVGTGTQAEWVEIAKGDWLIWEEGKWKKKSQIADGVKRPLAHLEEVRGKTLVLEGWEGDQHVRLALPMASSPPFKVRGEDLFTAVRARSEKQISCVLDKQCLILRLGDWVLKGEGRWKILRKKKDREAFQRGDLVGELFVLDKIETKQGQKFIRGSFFNASRSQVASLELPALSRKRGKNLSRAKERLR